MSLTLKFSRLTELDIQFITAMRILDAIVVKYTLVSFWFQSSKNARSKRGKLAYAKISDVVPAVFACIR